MVNRSELMEGNMLLYKGNVVTVDAIKKFWIEEKENGFFTKKKPSINDLEGILITTDWLGKLGFRYEESNKSYKQFENAGLVYWSGGIWLFGEMLPHIIYVHQLQNLYYLIYSKHLNKSH